MQLAGTRPGALIASQTRRFLRSGGARFRVAAGMADAALASMAGFGAALYAARFLEPDMLGAYAVYFAAFVFGGFVPANLYLLQARVVALKWPQERRIAILPRSILEGALFSGVAAVWTPIAGVLLLGQFSSGELVPLAVTASALVLVSPLQDHSRATFHMAGRPTRAVAVSACQLAVLAVSILVLHLALDVADQWVPFGSLVAANVASLSFGLILSGEDLRSHHVRLPPLRHIVTPGWALLLVALAPAFAQLAASTLVASFKSAEAAGYAEAARVVATPVHVAALGIAQALTPSLMEAGQNGSPAAARRGRLLFLLPLFGCTVLYAPVVGVDFVLNPMPHLLPNAYHEAGLVLISIGSLLALDLSLMPRAELTGAGRGGDLVGPAFAGSLAQVALVGALMWWLGSYVLPLGILACNGTMLCYGLARANRLYIISSFRRR
jgi:O-antigen/teichoic acid export membrane protein